jgi:hypothetical protein
MDTSGSSSARHWVWREHYIAALMEANDEKMSARIAQAERAMLGRARELFNSGEDNLQERRALGDALYALRALKSCLELHGGFAAESPSSRSIFLRSDGSLLA